MKMFVLNKLYHVVISPKPKVNVDVLFNAFAII